MSCICLSMKSTFDLCLQFLESNLTCHTSARERERESLSWLLESTKPQKYPFIFISVAHLKWISQSRIMLWSQPAHLCWKICFLSKNYAKYNLFLGFKAEFSTSLVQSSVSHDSSEITWHVMWRFTAQETYFQQMSCNIF